MNAREDALDELIRQLSQAARMLLETRAREAMAAANVTTEDLKAGRAMAERVTDIHPQCGGSGIVTTFDTNSERLFATVHVCECFEVKIIRPIVDPLGGDRFVHV